MFTLTEAIEALTGIPPQGVDLVITEGAVDSRLVIPGSMFFALPGEKVDGHAYVGDAFHHGATIAVVQKDLSSLFPMVDLRAHPHISASDLPRIPFCVRVDDSLQALQQIARFIRGRRSIQVVGITGSVGKSTTKELIADVLSFKFNTLRNQGNLNNEIGLPLTLLRLSRGQEFAVLEMGFYVPGEIAFLCEIATPRIGVITNIGTVHAERAGSIEEIARGKSELVQSLPSSPEGVAVLNYDDPLVRQMADKTKARVLFYGLNPKAEIWADKIIGQGLEGIRFTIHHGSDVFNLRVPLIGQHSVHTALRAAAVGLAAGMSWEEIIAALGRSHTQLRLVAVYAPSGALILDDTYNASPESTLAALNLLEELDGDKIAALGDMLELGQYEVQGHEIVGARAAEIVNELVTLGERGKIIAHAAVRSGLPESAVHSFESNDEAVAYLRPRLKRGDVLLVKGSHGMRMDRLVTGLEKPR